MTDYLTIETGLTLTAKAADSAALVITLDLSDTNPFLSERGAYLMNEKKLIFGSGKKRTLSESLHRAPISALRRGNPSI